MWQGESGRVEITHLPHEAVAEVSKDKKPIGAKCEIQLTWESTDLKFNWFQIQLIWKVNCFETQLLWDSTDLRVNWFQLQLISTSIDFNFNWFEIQLVWKSIGLKFDFRFKLKAWKRSFSARLFLQTWSFEALKRSFSARLPSKTELRSSKTKLFCETSFKNGASKFKNKSFLRDFLQKWSFEALKRSFSARLPSKMKLRNSKTKLFCDTSFKNGTSGTNRASSDHKGDTVTLCDRRGTPSTLGHLRPYFLWFKT